ncbi:hypothetical protein FGIG_10189 [Fasciola gigantica]|uniref:Uncharacterized protein n=1 Tax=Fasciola gigantica TaxID=46835 RepID=A0A504YUR7_FASGI|nr:hypothetical protein FGIG_10189 [Fasciola gigantica]
MAFYVAICILITFSDYFKLEFKLKYLVGLNETAQEVWFGLKVVKTFGFYDDIEAPVQVVLSERPRSKKQKSKVNRQFNEFIRQQVGEIHKQWNICYHERHRARIFRNGAAIALTVGLTSLHIALAIFMVNRIAMIRCTRKTVEILLVTICLKYITLVDYAVCLCNLNNRPESRSNLKSVFAIGLHRATKRTVLFAWSLLFLGGPLYLIGTDLTLFDSKSL